MPFTPYHLGPALGFGIPFQKFIHVPTFILANVIVDVEPFLVLVFGLSYPLHGYLHTFLLTFFLGSTLGYVMFLLEKYLHPLYKTLLLMPDQTLNLKSFIVSGILGTSLHVLLDSPLYSDIRPFFPFMTNPIYNSDLSMEVYSFCVWMGLLGIIIYVAQPILKFVKRHT